MSRIENVIQQTGECSVAFSEPMTPEDARALAQTLRVLADPARLRIISIVASHHEAEACVCKLTEPLGLTQPTVSHHLRILVEAGFLTRSKRGTWAYYKLIPGSLDRVSNLLKLK